MRNQLLLVGALTALTLGCHRGRPADDASVLPLKTLRLYETGVGYFERRGTLGGGTKALPVPASHVDDALKTLVLMADDRKGVSVSGIEFSSVVSQGLARSLAALPLESDKPVTYRDVLESMKGVEVEVERAEGRVVGTLVEVVDAPPIPLPDDAPPPAAGASKDTTPKPRFVPDTENDYYLTLMTRGGAVQRFRASRVESVRATDPTFSEKLGSAVTALSARAAQVRRNLRVLATSSVPVRLGYIAEAPVWRSTYRLILDPKGDRGVLRGWALIHNDTDEQWAEVKVELVNGRPDSFLFPLTAPRYTRRPLAEPAEIMSTVPQLADQTPDQIWGDHLGGGGFGTGQGFGSGHGRLGGSHRARAPRVRMGSTSVTTGESSDLSIGNLAQVAQATGTESGALFNYQLAETLDLRAHGSALVPFTQAEVKARRMTWFASSDAEGRSAARIINSTRQTLPSGPVAIYEASGFAGETGVRRLKPGERAFVQFGIDLDVELEVERSKSREELRKVEFDDGALVEHFVRHHDRQYELENRSGSPRKIYLVLDIVKNATVRGADELDFNEEAKTPLAVFDLAKNTKKQRTLQIQEALERRTRAGSLSSERLTELAGSEALPEAHRKILEEAAGYAEDLEDNGEERRDAERDQEKVREDLERMREHLKALGDKSGSPAGNNPIVQRILDLEDDLDGAREELEDLAEERQEIIEELSAELAKLNDEDTGQPTGPLQKAPPQIP